LPVFSNATLNERRDLASSIRLPTAAPRSARRFLKRRHQAAPVRQLDPRFAVARLSAARSIRRDQVDVARLQASAMGDRRPP
jgi:hypothetical protein